MLCHDSSTVRSSTELSQLRENHLFIRRATAMFVLWDSPVIERRGAEHDPGVTSRTGTGEDAHAQ